MLTTLQIAVLAVVQGAAELLPVSSSAHVIVAEKLMGLDPTSPAMTLLLVSLHSGTMLAVIVYFWNAWKRTFFTSTAAFTRTTLLMLYSTALTALVGYPIKLGIEKIFLRATPNAEIEMIFGNLVLMAVALGAVGLLILYAGLRPARSGQTTENIGWRQAGLMGAVQGLCLPFRGFSRSGATISTGLIAGGSRARVEEYSFALAVILTPPIVFREVKRLLVAQPTTTADGSGAWHLFAPSLLGFILSFLAGLAALAWLSRWLENGRWHLFGIYCLFGAAGILSLHFLGF